MTPVYLTNDVSDVSGYLLAAIGTRSPNATAAGSTAVTATSAQSTGTEIAMTLTSGGSTAKWITAPLDAAVTIAASALWRLFGFESNAAANAGLGINVLKYTAGAESTTIIDSTFGAEVGATVEQDMKVVTPTSVALAAGDRIVIKPVLYAVGTMAAGYFATMNYGGTEAAIGAAAATTGSMVMFSEAFQPNRLQFPQHGPQGIGNLEGLRSAIQRKGWMFGDNCLVRELLNELGYQRDAQGA